MAFSMSTASWESRHVCYLCSTDTRFGSGPEESSSTCLSDIKKMRSQYRRIPFTVGVAIADELPGSDVWPACLDAIVCWAAMPRSPHYPAKFLVHPSHAWLAEVLTERTALPAEVMPVLVDTGMERDVGLPATDSRWVIAADCRLVRECEEVLVLHEYAYKRDPRFLPMLWVAEHQRKPVWRLAHSPGVHLNQVPSARLAYEIRKIFTNWHTTALTPEENSPEAEHDEK
ncbi:MAG TPA: hypothetical protein VKD22_07910 [Ramlibacter sp.]|nr:hypothetical protein [Ramlibacter sp.]